MASIGGAGQERIASGTILLHGQADLCATYLVAAGLGCLRVTGDTPRLGARDPAFRLETGVPGDAADVVVDFADGAAFKAASGPALHVLAGGRWSRPVVETVAAAEALRALIGLPPHSYAFLSVKGYKSNARSI